MPLPLAPIAGFAIRYGAVALSTYAITKSMRNSVSKGRRDQKAEDALDGLDEGVTLRRETGQSNATSRWKRTIRVGANGPAYEIDFGAIGRISVRKLK